MSSWIKRGLSVALVLAGASLTAGTAQAQYHGGHHHHSHHHGESGHYGYGGFGSVRPSYGYHFSYRTPSFSYSYGYGNSYGGNYGGYVRRSVIAPRYPYGHGYCR